MPIYEYYCESCDRTYEIMQKITDPPIAVCDICGGPLKKKISLSAFHLKGSGWYATDYARNNGAKSNGTGKQTEKKKEAIESPAKESKESDTAEPKESKAGKDSVA